MQDQKYYQNDFVVSIILIAFSLLIVVQSVRMPKYETWGMYAMPGIAPFLFGSLLLVLSVFLLVRSVRKGGHRMSLGKEQFQALLRSNTARRFVFVLATVIVYFLLLGKLNFVIVTMLLLYVLIAFFKGAKWWTNLIISFVTSFSVWFIFYKIFLVPLP